jgi:hypothetical protein
MRERIMYEWEDRLRIALVAKIEEAINATDRYYLEQEHLAVFPYQSDGTSRMMAEAAIAVLKAIEENQNWLQEEEMLDL